MGLCSCLEECVALEGPVGSSGAYGEGTEEPEPGSARWCWAAGQQATGTNLDRRGLERRRLSPMRIPVPAAQRGCEASILGGLQDLTEGSSEQLGLILEPTS